MNSLTAFIGKVVDKTIETTKDVANKATDIYHDENLRQQAKNVGSSVYQSLKGAGELAVNETKQFAVTVKEKGVVNYSKELGAKAIDKTIDVGAQAYDFTKTTAVEVKQQTQEKGVLGYSKELANKGVDSVKQTYTHIESAIKGSGGANQNQNQGGMNQHEHIQLNEEVHTGNMDEMTALSEDKKNTGNDDLSSENL
eukprot:CAMPEP_0176432984 /NCGR_PEP_ID=MMETSP0127-20121128/15730_1 /TAXON_ID=938130 /ORGANISM="Platyophrya macrostoma, Strain WH" /LENGTH=196 /DNA_ID=CAMNT_0017815281 /DNA_START=48 /DNA_END=638 /DNA_ORIENTATION=+